MQDIKIIRPIELRTISGISKTKIWELQKEGLMVRQIKLGARATGYLQHEVQTVLAAIAAGYTDSQLKTLVIMLEGQRQTLIADLLKQINNTESTEA